MLQPLAERHSIRLSINAETGLSAVLVDYERILRVFSNLVVNAVKFSVAGAEVRVAAARHGETVRFSVIDTGEGIRPEHLEQIFDRFWQADAMDRRGAGLGARDCQGHHHCTWREHWRDQRSWPRQRILLRTSGRVALARHSITRRFREKNLRR